jgi:predicted phage terminase large subunit-like protein
MDDAILDAVTGKTPRLIVEIPVRHGKSELGSYWTPTWFLDRFPQKQIALTSYGAELAQGFSRKVRDTIEANTGLLRCQLDRRSRSAKRWHTTQGGGMLATGVGGPLTGWGADLLLVDDPIKNAEEAESETVRDALWEWWRSTAYTRIEPGAAAIVFAARWHEDDLIGRILKQAEEEGQEQWRVVRLPALAEAGDPLGRQEGAALWPERRGAADLMRIKRAIGSYYFNALYQQRPSPAEGSILMRHWWKYWSALPRVFDLLVFSWDMSFTDKEDSSYVVGQLWGKAGGDFFLLDQIRDRMNFPDTKRAVRAFKAKYPHVLHILVEDKANGPALIAELKHEITGIIPINPLVSKIARARAASGPLEAGNVYLPSVARFPWVVDFVEEAAVFPNGTFDDQVDAFSQAIVRMNGVPVYAPDDYANTQAA